MPGGGSPSLPGHAGPTHAALASRWREQPPTLWSTLPTTTPPFSCSRIPPGRRSHTSSRTWRTYSPDGRATRQPSRRLRRRPGHQTAFPPALAPWTLGPKAPKGGLARPRCPLQHDLPAQRTAVPRQWPGVQRKQIKQRQLPSRTVTTPQAASCQAARSRPLWEAVRPRATHPPTPLQRPPGLIPPQPRRRRAGGPRDKVARRHRANNTTLIRRGP